MSEKSMGTVSEDEVVKDLKSAGVKCPSSEVKVQDKANSLSQGQHQPEVQEEWNATQNDLDPEHDNYIFIKFKSGTDNDIQVSKGKGHFHVHEEPVASGSQTGVSGTDTTTSPEKSWPSLLAESDSDSEREWSDDEVDHLNTRLQRHLRDLYADRDTDSFILQLLQDLDPMNLDLTARHLLNENSEEPLYPCKSKVKGTCQVCFEDDIDTRERLCCSIPVCEQCLKEYLKTEVSQRNVRLQCINCESYVHRDEILALLPNDLKEKFYQFLLEENKDPDIKTCPRCCFLQNKKDILKSSSSTMPKNMKNKRKKKMGRKVICEKCGLTWCFDCHAPWHENIKCKEFRKGDKLVKNWAKEFNYGQKNAVKCPKCKVFIQKRSGCSHMTCRNCNTSFCYRCGHRYIQMKLIGKHSDRFSPFGCKYNLLPDKPVARKAVRGSVLGAKIFGGVLLGGLIVAAAAVFIGGSVIIVPAYFGVKYFSWRKKQKLLRSYIHKRAEISKIRMSTQQDQGTNTQNIETALRDLELGVSEFNHSDTMTSSESSSSNDHHGSTEVKVWVHSEDRDLDVGVKFKSQEQQTTLHENTVTTAEVTMEDDLVVLHVKTISKLPEGEVTATEQEVDGSKNKEDETEETENSDALWEERNSEGNGCFVKILGKLPVKWEKEDEKEMKLKESLSIKPAIVRDKKKEEEKDGKVKEKRRKIGTRRARNHHDLIQETEKLDSVEKWTNYDKDISTETEDVVLSEIQEIKHVCDVDPYMGVVSMETCDTVF